MRQCLSYSHLGLRKVDLPALPAYVLKPRIPTRGSSTLLRPPIADNDYLVVQEY